MDAETARYCADMVRDDDYDRYLTVLCAAPEHRRALFALYAFNQEVAKTREQVTEPTLGEIRLQWWRETVDGLYQGDARRHPVAEELAAAPAAGLPKALLIEIIDGRVGDLYDDAPKRFDDLFAYADATGGAVTEAAVRLTGTDARRALAVARSVGVAWALVGLVRAFGFHAEMRRSYLPEAEMAAAGIARETLFRGEFAPELTPLIERLGDEARRRIKAARGYRAEVPAGARPVLLIAGLAEGYLDRLKAARGNPLDADFHRGKTGRLLRLYGQSLTGRF
ncbi:hypothetical protein CCR85_10410 [Rhodothalassium salexigens]|uniref:phytoene/squalene synthase family protein n=1 Tax=Rhodothalassium salexigens TaxID=1086 RepID=UPI001911FD35|nr:squalene/phytoene synthase family protein [Rhodothalassium salexigens]MBK5911900.1 hypothetical protein [Rhodothalassium salexigens]MBK5921151.1 hypothetical protein [Rhodothalassium salexigens]